MAWLEPRNFFEQHVRRSYEEWLRDPLDEHRAKTAACEANNMAARVFHCWKDRDRNQIYGAKGEGQYRDELAAHECEDFALVRDVAEAHKHVELSRPSRLVTRYDQTAAEVSWWDEARWDDDARWGGQLVVTLDDGTRRPLAEIMRNVIAMWERLLDRMML